MLEMEGGIVLRPPGLAVNDKAHLSTGVTDVGITRVTLHSANRRSWAAIWTTTNRFQQFQGSLEGLEVFNISEECGGTQHSDDAVTLFIGHTEQSMTRR